MPWLAVAMFAGIADNALTTVWMALPRTTPQILCPAMNTRMWRNAVVQRNVKTVEELGHRVLTPDEGALACGHTGPGRLPEPAEILKVVEEILAG